MPQLTCTSQHHFRAGWALPVLSLGAGVPSPGRGGVPRVYREGPSHQSAAVWCPRLCETSFQTFPTQRSAVGDLKAPYVDSKSGLSVPESCSAFLYFHFLRC